MLQGSPQILYVCVCKLETQVFQSYFQLLQLAIDQTLEKRPRQRAGPINMTGKENPEYRRLVQKGTGFELGRKECPSHNGLKERRERCSTIPTHALLRLRSFQRARHSHFTAAALQHSRGQTDCVLLQTDKLWLDFPLVGCSPRKLSLNLKL